MMPIPTRISNDRTTVSLTTRTRTARGCKQSQEDGANFSHQDLFYRRNMRNSPLRLNSRR
ncbi:hypothetical protein I7I53_01777 [Histoplasma capsulatum var. duboisii H88]|uniref:Uncharacterized protein n=1 Tax=Ajellomyces capsulatus (strain H88) TaxID=544711 RepID=A0A8A1LMH8_AJEC8|nr:hypothetical protein I7I53_01777 [Histoplasma capsulatum var. duboisii H88]